MICDQWEQKLENDCFAPVFSFFCHFQLKCEKTQIFWKSQKMIKVNDLKTKKVKFFKLNSNLFIQSWMINQTSIEYGNIHIYMNLFGFMKLSNGSVPACDIVNIPEHSIISWAAHVHVNMTHDNTDQNHSNISHCHMQTM